MNQFLVKATGKYGTVEQVADNQCQARQLHRDYSRQEAFDNVTILLDGIDITGEVVNYHPILQ